MNSLADILSKKADDLFPAPPAPPDPQAPLRSMIYAMKSQLDAMLRLLDGHAPLPSGERVVLGTFTGEKMAGDDGKEYAVPPNYASKSKIVPGDRMKLTVTKSGSFIYSK